jgi:phosphatidylserine/phosphatidylglycerophosphate/cardiolipin synthase-like enzyme
MRIREENEYLSVHAIAGTYCVLLGLDVKGFGELKPDLIDLPAMLSEMILDPGRPRKGNVEMTTPSVTAGSTWSARAVADTHLGSSNCSVFVGFSIDRQDQVTKQIVSLNAGGKPIQKFHFGDYTALPGREYVYTVGRMIKIVSAVDSAAQFVVDGSSTVALTVSTEDPNVGTHGIFFNRGAAGSKAYSEKFGEFRKFHKVNHYNKAEWRSIINPRAIPDPEKSAEARAWLSRGLEEALLQFIAQATGSEYRLLAAVYEFTHEETIQAFASAVERGVDVKIIRHYKGTFRAKTENGKAVKDWIPDSTTEEATKAIDAVGFDNMRAAHTWHHDTFIERRHSSGLMHNKFIILLKQEKPVSLWTGSINFTDSGFYGQSNVGHVVRDDGVAGQYLKYWLCLSRDTPGRKRSSHENDIEPMDDINVSLQPDLDGPIESPSIHVIFSPRKTGDMLQWYADRLAGANTSVHYTAAFGIAQTIAQIFNQGHSIEGLRRSPRIARHNKISNASDGLQLRYLLLDSKPSIHSREKNEEIARKKGEDYKDYYDLVHVKENRIAYGAVLHPNGDDIASEECLTGLSTFVDYVHTKYLIVDALTDTPLVITGSANFSAASTDKNDENMLVIFGDTRVADIYLTEFMRLFDHFYSRDKYNDQWKQKSSSGDWRGTWGEVVADESWLGPYFDPSTQLYCERLFLR